MDHLRFKSDQTAAAYVADGLDPERREAFELHMMCCPECVEEVESWRAIKDHLPHDTPKPDVVRDEPAVRCESATRDELMARQEPAVDGERMAGARPASRDLRRSRAHAAKPAARQEPKMVATAPLKPSPAAPRWRLAAMLAAGLVAGVAGGWYGRSAQGPSLDARSIGFYSLPPVSRGPADCTTVRLGSHVSLLALRIPGAVPDQQLVAVDSEGHDLSLEDYSVQTQGDGSWLVRVGAAIVREQDIRFEARSADGTVEPHGCVVSATRA